MRGTVLVVDDDAALVEAITEGLGRRGFAARACGGGADALHALSSEEADVVLADIRMKEMDGIELCRRIGEARPDLPVVVITAFGSLDAAVGAIRAGAYDFVTKPIEIEALGIVLDRAVQHRSLRIEVKRLQRAVDASSRFEELLGASSPMQVLYELLGRVAESDATVLVSGETGTGKELVARALHARGRRRGGPFVPVNCAAVPEAVLESELFGHVRGAFTDAREDREGLFRHAEGGTLFLDEIAELPLGLQAKLLRALQERAIRPVGANVEQPFDARVVAATNRDLESAVEEGRFREDLYFRIVVIHLEIPPLRARGTDILMLAHHALSRFSARALKPPMTLTPAAAQKLLAYPWPGNVRELNNAMERAVALASYDHLGVADLPDKVREYRPGHVVLAGEDPSELISLEELEHRYIQRVLQLVGGNKVTAARILGIDRKTIHRKLGRYAREAVSPPASDGRSTRS